MDAPENASSGTSIACWAHEVGPGRDLLAHPAVSQVAADPGAGDIPPRRQPAGGACRAAIACAVRQLDPARATRAKPLRGRSVPLPESRALTGRWRLGPRARREALALQPALFR